MRYFWTFYKWNPMVCTLCAWLLLLSTFVWPVRLHIVVFIHSHLHILFYCLFISQIIYFTLDGYLGCFQFLAIKMNAAMNIVLHVFWWKYVCISVRYMPRGGIQSQNICLGSFFVNSDKQSPNAFLPVGCCSFNNSPYSLACIVLCSFLVSAPNCVPLEASSKHSNT